MGGEQDDWMWVCVGWSRGVLVVGERGNVSCGFSFLFLGFGWVEL